jgi:hypothetical protein
MKKNVGVGLDRSVVAKDWVNEAVVVQRMRVQRGYRR